MSGPQPDMAEFEFAVSLARDSKRWRRQALAVRRGATGYPETAAWYHRAARNSESLLHLIAAAAERSAAP